MRRIYCEEASRIYMKQMIIQMQEFREQRLKECLAARDFVFNESIEKYSQPIRNKHVVLPEYHGKSKSLHARQRNVDIDNEFLISDELKLKTYDKRKVLKESLQNYDTSSLDLSQKIKQSFLDEAMNNPYLKAQLNKRLYVMNLKKEIEKREMDRQLNIYFRDNNSFDLKREKSFKGNIIPNIPAVIKNEQNASSKNGSTLFNDVSNSKGEKYYYSNLKSFQMIAKNTNDTILNESSQLPLKCRGNEMRKERGLLPKLNKHATTVHKRNVSMS